MSFLICVNVSVAAENTLVRVSVGVVCCYALPCFGVCGGSEFVYEFLFAFWRIALE